MTRKAQMSAGSKHIIALINCPGETINNANIETTIPDTAKIRSNGLNILNINLPLLAFAGIK